MSPRVSILMTCFDRQDFLPEAVESVLASRYEDFELIIVDDCSRDRSFELATSYAERDSRLKVFRNEQNLGDYPNRNRAASYAVGHYLKYLDSDDRIYPWGLGAMVECMDAYPQAGLGLSTQDSGDRPHPVCLSPREAYVEHYLRRRSLFGRAPGSAIIRRSAFEALGGFSGIRHVGDHEFWSKAAREFPVVTLPRDLIWDRVHGAQEQFIDSQRQLRMHFDIDCSALNHAECPLDSDEVAESLSKLRWPAVRQFWLNFVARGRFAGAYRFRNEAGLSVRDLLRF